MDTVKSVQFSCAFGLYYGNSNDGPEIRTVIIAQRLIQSGFAVSISNNKTGIGVDQ
jgi:hypothetical protein